MSCYGWQKGDIVIPSAEWAGLKAAVRDAWNRERTKRLADALRLHEAIVKEAEGVRNVDWRLIVNKVCPRFERSIPDVWRLAMDVFESKSRTPDGKYRDPLSVKGSAGRPNKPLKGDYAPAGNRTNEFRLIHASIVFDDATRTVTWSVPENNRSVQDAHEEPVAIAFFAALKRVKWTARSGGSIIGNDEMNQHEGRDHEGGGGNYVSMRFGQAEVEWKKEIASWSKGGRRASGGAFSPFGGRAW